MSRKITSVDEKRLLLESGGFCAFPDCNQKLIAPDTASESGAILAELAHIVSDSREGPRGEVVMSEEERNQHGNLIVLCPTHHKVIDSQPNTFSIQVLRQMKLDHLKHVARLAETQPIAPATVAAQEIIQSAVLGLSHLPQAVYEAECAFQQGQEDEVRERWIAPKDHEVLLPFVLESGRLYCFQNLTRLANPFSNTINANTARPLQARSMWKNENERRLYVRLLNRSLYKYTGHRGVRFDNDHKRFFFIPDEPGAVRSVRYQSLTGRTVQRNVVWRPIRKKTGMPTAVWWHVAAGLRFHNVAEMQWCLSIRPEWHLTKDGQEPLEGKRVGRKVTSKKSRMFNYEYLREVNFWRDFLADGKPRIILNFDDQSAVIDCALLAFAICWPGIPGDSRDIDTEPRDDDLFSLSELQEALGGEHVEWEEEEQEQEESGLEEAGEF